MGNIPVDLILQTAQKATADTVSRARAYGFKPTPEHVTMLRMQFKVWLALVWFEAEYPEEVRREHDSASA